MTPSERVSVIIPVYNEVRTVASLVRRLGGFVFWIVLPFRRYDGKPLPDEAAFAEVVRRQGAGPGQYAFPYPRDPKEQGDPRRRCGGTRPGRWAS